jgi:hypothetical protein
MLGMISLYSLQKIEKRYILLLMAFPLLATIRPYMGFVLIAAVIAALFLRNPSKYKASHIFIGMLSLVSLIAFIPFITSFLSIDQLEMNAINQRIEFYTDHGANKTDSLNSYVDVSSYSLPMKMFAYLFRPLFFDAHSMLQLMASFENIFLLFILLKWAKSIRFKFFKWYRILREPDKILVMFVLAGWIILAASMYNLGLASRQKYMLLPVIFVLIFRDLSYGRLKKNHNQ